jgi:hypothetical protein
MHAGWMVLRDVKVCRAQPALHSRPSGGQCVWCRFWCCAPMMLNSQRLTQCATRYVCCRSMRFADKLCTMVVNRSGVLDPQPQSRSHLSNCNRNSVCTVFRL